MLSTLYGGFSSKPSLGTADRWEAQGTDFPALLAKSKNCTLPVIVSICDFLPLPTERNENGGRCRFIVKLTVNDYRCTCEEITSTMMKLWQKACQKFGGSWLEVRKLAQFIF